MVSFNFTLNISGNFISQSNVRGLVRKHNLQVPILNTGSNLEQVPLGNSQKIAESEEPLEPILTRPLNVI